MGLTGILAIVVVALFVVMVKFVVDGCREKNYKKVIVSIVVCCGVIFMIFFGLLELITSM